MLTWLSVSKCICALANHVRGTPRCMAVSAIINVHVNLRRSAPRSPGNTVVHPSSGKQPITPMPKSVRVLTSGCVVLCGPAGHGHCSRSIDSAGQFWIVIEPPRDMSHGQRRLLWSPDFLNPITRSGTPGVNHVHAWPGASFTAEPCHGSGHQIDQIDRPRSLRRSPHGPIMNEYIRAFNTTWTSQKAEEFLQKTNDFSTFDSHRGGGLFYPTLACRRIQMGYVFPSCGLRLDRPKTGPRPAL